ncbi:MAG: hypothetical protein H7122_07135 [Chitinophagaceae bacterium]|nr:hypothetical protein [Chitinophagaceae bacterium]
MTKIFLPAIIFICINACTTEIKPVENFNVLAEKYVRLGLTIGQYDADFVDAYYGPDSLKPASAKSAGFPKDSLLSAVKTLQEACKKYTDSSQTNDTLRTRATWMSRQLDAFAERIKIFSGNTSPFNDESKQLFSVEPPVYNEDHFKSLVGQLDSLLPGAGQIPERMQVLAKKFIIPKDKVDTVFKTAIEEARKRTRVRYEMPANESFVLEYVNDKPWSGYNWYKGNYQSVIQINIDLPILIDRAIDLACHEGYPGHHVYNVLLEKNLYRDKGWVEFSLYPLYSPQSLIAEGSANYGIEMSFPGNEGADFAKKTLLPVAGLDSSQVEVYFKTLSLKSKLNYARNEAARGLLNGTMDEKEALRWLTQYCLMSNEMAAKSISFIRKNRSYVICYNYGLDLVRNYIESRGGTASAPDKRWELFGWLLSNPVTPVDLLAEKK